MSNSILVNNNNNNGFDLSEMFIVASPLIVAAIFTSLSFIYQNWTGLLYLFLLVTMCVFRYLILSKMNVSNSSNCKYIKNLENGFSIFVFAFTFGYVFLPMFIFNDVNLPLLILI